MANNQAIIDKAIDISNKTGLIVEKFLEMEKTEPFLILTQNQRDIFTALYKANLDICEELKTIKL